MIFAILIVLLFALCSLFIIRRGREDDLSKVSMSQIASRLENIRVVQLLCYSVALLVIPYNFELINRYSLSVNHPTIIFGTIAATSLVITAFSIYKPESIIHKIDGFTFFVCLLVMPLYLFGAVGFISSIPFFFSIIFIFIQKIRNKNILSAYSEMILMLINSFWVLILVLPLN